MNLSNIFLFSCFQVPGLNSPIYKEYHRTLIQERDRDMTDGRSYGDEYNLFSCLSRFVCTFVLLAEHDNNFYIIIIFHSFIFFSLRNPWLPGWILTTTLVLSVLVLIWICCATVATAVDQYVPTEVSPSVFHIAVYWFFYYI